MPPMLRACSVADFRLETARLVLRDWREEDWAVFWKHTNTPAVMRWLGGVCGEAARQTAQDRLESYRADHGHTFWLVERKADGGQLAGEVLGFCGLKRCNQVGSPIGDFEIGWRLREDAWGQGYALEAARAAMGCGFEQFHAPHMVALTVASNAASWGLMRRLGMERREDLDFFSTDFAADDSTIIAYSITRSQWEARHG